MCWKGYFTYKKTEGKFCYLSMYKEPPGNYNPKKNFSKIYDEADRHEGAKFELSHCREEDLIVLSKFRVNLDGQDDIKMAAGGAKFLKEVLQKNGVMFGYVHKSSSKSDPYV